MPIRFSTTDPGFDDAFRLFLAAKREASPEVDAAVADIIAQVQRDGDSALAALTQKFDRVDLGTIGIRVSDDEISDAMAASDQEVVAALIFARDRIESHHRRQLPRDDRYADA